MGRGAPSPSAVGATTRAPTATARQSVSLRIGLPPSGDTAVTRRRPREVRRAQTSIRIASPWPPPEQIAASPKPPPLPRRPRSLVPAAVGGGVGDQRAGDPPAARTDRVAERDRAAVDIRGLWVGAEHRERVE